MIYSIFSSGSTGLEIVAYILAYGIAVIFAIVAHEYAHAFAAVKSGDPTPKLTGRLSFNPFRHMDSLGMISFLFIGFGWAKPVQINPINFRNYKKGMFFVSTAGIFTNLIIAFVFSFFSLLMTRIADQNLFYTFLYLLFTFITDINVALAIFNFLPIYPLDGFNTIATFLRHDNKFVQFMRQYGQLILILLVVTGLLMYPVSYAVGGVEWLFYSFWGLMI